MTTYSEYKELQNKQNAIVDNLSDQLNLYPKGEFGMTEESIRLSDEFKSVNSKFNKEFKNFKKLTGLE